jgi:hypothetical protein
VREREREKERETNTDTDTDTDTDADADADAVGGRKASTSVSRIGGEIELAYELAEGRERGMVLRPLANLEKTFSSFSALTFSSIFLKCQSAEYVLR